jgi:hypothetical protein
MKRLMSGVLMSGVLLVASVQAQSSIPERQQASE